MHRPADPEIWLMENDPATNSYWRHFVQCIEPDGEASDMWDSIALTGFVCDEGVRRNHGRPGAKDGPDAIRRALAQLAWHGEGSVFDTGNIQCQESDLETAQQAFGETVADLLKAGAFPVGLGGGHEIAYGTWLGIHRHVGNARLGIVNFDAHFDLRKPVDGKGNSGTPFYQIAEQCRECGIPFLYQAVGIQSLSNMEELFERAVHLHVGWIPAEKVRSHDLSEVRDALQMFLEACDFLYVSCCLDVFSAVFAPGVSAVNPLGVSPNAVIALYQDLFASGKVIAADIAELNPKYDIDNRTAKLAAALVYNVKSILE